MLLEVTRLGNSALLDASPCDLASEGIFNGDKVNPEAVARQKNSLSGRDTHYENNNMNNNDNTSSRYQ